MASADFSQFVVTTVSFTACETSRDKPASLSSSTCLIYAHGLRLPFGLRCLWPAYPPCTPYIRFLFVRLRLRYPFFSPTSHDVNLGSRYGGSSATTPLVDFHHRLTACPSYRKKALFRVLYRCRLFYIGIFFEKFTGRAFIHDRFRLVVIHISPGSIRQSNTSENRALMRHRHWAQEAVNGRPIHTSCACSSHFFSHAFSFSLLQFKRPNSSASMCFTSIGVKIFLGPRPFFSSLRGNHFIYQKCFCIYIRLNTAG